MSGKKTTKLFNWKKHYSQAPADSKICLVKNKNAIKVQLAPKLFSGEKQSTTVKLLLPGILFIVKQIRE